jgi:hypothetical protein
MPATGYLAGGQVIPRRAGKLNSAGKVVLAQAADMTGATAGNSPPLGIIQAQSRGAPGTPWSGGWTGSVTAVTPTGLPIAADTDQEVHVFDTDGDECEAELATPTAADLDAGANTLTAGGAIVFGDKLTAGTDGVLFKLGGAGYYVAVALTDVALDNTTTNSILETSFGMVRIEKGFRLA